MLFFSKDIIIAAERQINMRDSVIELSCKSLLTTSYNLTDSDLKKLQNSSFKNGFGEFLSYFSMGEIGKANKSIKVEKLFYGEQNHQYYLLFLPQTSNFKKTLIVYLHGGGWNHFEPNDFKFVGKFFADRGYPTISIGYRLTPKAKYPSQIEDILVGYSKAIQDLKTKNLQIDNMIIIGFSSGAQLGGNILYNTDLRKQYKTELLPIKGFCSIAGPLRFKTAFGNSLSANHILDLLFEKGYDRTKAEPYNFVFGNENIPVLCIHSINDPCNFQTSVEFIEKVNQNGSKLGNLYLETDKHFHHINLGLGLFLEDMPARQALIEWLKKIDN